MIGGTFTWYSASRNGKIRIDKIMLSLQWLEKWPESKQYIMDRMVPDHYAIVLKIKECDWSPKLFRTPDVENNHVGFIDIVRTMWGQYRVCGNDIWVLKEKLKQLNGDLKVCNKEIFGILTRRNLILFQPLEVLIWRMRITRYRKRGS